MSKGKKRILWIERELNQICAASVCLQEKLGIEVLRGKNFDEGWSLFEKNALDAVFMEPQFPRLHNGKYSDLQREEIGKQFVRDVRNVRLNIPIVLVSTINNPCIDQEFVFYKEAECNFLYKPYSLEELEAIVKKIL